jgi:hypothetical protein
MKHTEKVSPFNLPWQFGKKIRCQVEHVLERVKTAITNTNVPSTLSRSMWDLGYSCWNSPRSSGFSHHVPHETGQRNRARPQCVFFHSNCHTLGYNYLTCWFRFVLVTRKTERNWGIRYTYPFEGQTYPEKWLVNCSFTGAFLAIRGISSTAQNYFPCRIPKLRHDFRANIQMSTR